MPYRPPPFDPSPPSDVWRSREPYHCSLPPTPPPVDYPSPPIYNMQKPAMPKCTINKCRNNLPHESQCKLDACTPAQQDPLTNCHQFNISHCQQQQSNSHKNAQSNCHNIAQSLYKSERYSGKKRHDHECCCVTFKKFEPKKWSAPGELPCCDLAHNCPLPSCLTGTLKDMPCLDKFQLPCVNRAANHTCGRKTANSSCESKIENTCKLSATCSCFQNCDLESYNCCNN